MTLQCCAVCGTHGDSVEGASRYDPAKLTVWRTYEVTHRNGLTHRFETTNLPNDDERYEVRHDDR